MKLVNFRRLGFIFLTVLAPIVGLTTDDKTRAAEHAAVGWLNLVDTAQYEDSWNHASSLFRTRVSPSDWQTAVSAARNPLGGVVGRKLVSATYETTLPGAPDGEYIVLLFHTEFENKIQAVETVTPMLDEGQWRVAGYYIR